MQRPLILLQHFPFFFLTSIAPFQHCWTTEYVFSFNLINSRPRDVVTHLDPPCSGCSSGDGLGSALCYDALPGGADDSGLPRPPEGRYLQSLFKGRFPPAAGERRTGERSRRRRVEKHCGWNWRTASVSVFMTAIA